MDAVEVSVRHLVEFILRSGDIDSRYHGAPSDAMLEGAMIHRKIQGGMGSDYSAEVPLEITVPYDSFSIHISGRADGIINNNGRYTIDEIKGVYADVERMEQPVPVHLAQAECYAYIFAREMMLEDIDVRMTYCGIDTNNIRYFNMRYTFSELKCWFDELMNSYRKWAEFSINWKKIRDASIKTLEFPYEYREGQKELAGYVYRTIYHKKRLFLEAPTGVGKTSAVLFPSIKAVGEGIGGTVFYLTAKTVAASVAQDTYDLMRDGGLRFKTVNIVAKEKLCMLEKPECSPDKCPYAKGHYDRINDALFEFLQEFDSYEREDMRAYAEKKQVCPFEMALDLSLFADGIICDYNYVFDPDAYLRRFFGEGVRGDYLFLVDEAHNLVDRAREMYSASLIKEEVLDVRKAVKDKDKKLAGYLMSLSRLLSALEGEESFALHEDVSAVIMAAERAAGEFEEMLDDMPAPSDEVLDFYFRLRSFLNIAERLDDKYRIYTDITEDGRFMLKLFNVDPSKNLMSCLRKGRSTIFFSATILPVTYYMDLLSGCRDDFAVYARSTFPPENLRIFIEPAVSSKYTRRSSSEYMKIAGSINSIIRAHSGNYLIFFPSYQFMEEVYGRFCNVCGDEVECMIQDRGMTETQREDFLRKFSCEKEIPAEDIRRIINTGIELEGDHTLAGFCVLGGIFSEGIDLKEESLIGAVIVGTGLPMVCTEREILKGYFDAGGLCGFDYAYRIPGMNKVLQAAGRVIRTENDRGIVALLDERFCSDEYRCMFPAEWKDVRVLKPGCTEDQIKSFWDY